MQSMSEVDRAWDLVKDVDSPEAEALRALLGTSPFRLVTNSGTTLGDDAHGAASFIQEHIAKAYVHAHSAPAGVGVNPATVASLFDKIGTLSALARAELFERLLEVCCLVCGDTARPCDCGGRV
jgi:hypothetical protein